jgi:hypothetical protein
MNGEAVSHFVSCQALDSKMPAVGLPNEPAAESFPFRIHLNSRYNEDYL